MTNLPPNDVRDFVHKRLIRAATGFVTSGLNPLSAVSGFLRPTGPSAPTVVPSRKRSFGQRVSARRQLSAAPILLPAAQPPPVRRPVARTLTARPGAVSAAEKAAGRSAKFGAQDVIQPVIRAVQQVVSGAGGECVGPFRVWDEVQGRCVFGIGDQAGRDDTPIGATVMGRYGAGEVPGNMVVNRAICRPGMILGDDGICYNRSQISNKQREWPRGRRPLLTGGDMRAISTAARAGKRLEGATKRLQKIGLMKKPTSRVRRLKSGPTEHHHHE